MMSDDSGSAPSESAVFGGGCFWCTEAAFRRIRGVLEVRSGYAGGHLARPTYRQVCAGATGHAEVVRVEYDPREISYTDLLRVFFAVHDPTTKDRQGADVGPMYRSIILYQDASERDAARAFVAALEEEGEWGSPLVTEIEPLDVFWPAEEAHHEFYERSRYFPYCRAVIDPKLSHLYKAHGDLIE